jgi:hypothetical protein
MQVLSLGLPCTGTKSMQTALHILGYHNVHHGMHLIDRPSTSNAWETLVDATYGPKGGHPHPTPNSLRASLAVRYNIGRVGWV